MLSLKTMGQGGGVRKPKFWSHLHLLILRDFTSSTAKASILLANLGKPLFCSNIWLVWEWAGILRAEETSSLFSQRRQSDLPFANPCGQKDAWPVVTVVCPLGSCPPAHVAPPTLGPASPFPSSE